MIQRVQSVYLFVGALLLALFVVLNGLWTSVVMSVHELLPLLAYGFAALGGLAGFIAVFLHKNRSAQFRVISTARWLDLALILVLVISVAIKSFGGEEGAGQVSGITYGVILIPVAAYIFFRLALRAVQRDIELVRSADRLR